MKNNWVDFDLVKKHVGIQAVLDHYNLSGKMKKQPGNELRGDCPLRGHKAGSAKGGFKVNLTKNAFNCFGCHAHGNVLDFVAAMEDCNVPEAARILATRFAIGGAITASGATAADTKTGARLAPEEKIGKEGVGEAKEKTWPLKNDPLEFELQGIEPSHEYLSGRGVSKDTAAEFGIGFYTGKGKTMARRVVIPIHNEHGKLVAYAGRAIDGSEPKYKLPAKFHKSLELYNLHRAIEREGQRVSTVVLVEGYFGCIRVHTSGFPCVALMGSWLAEHQEELLCRYFTGAAILLDGNEAGKAGTDACLLRLGRRMWVKAVDLPDGKQPDDLTSEQLTALLKGGT